MTWLNGEPMDYPQSGGKRKSRRKKRGGNILDIPDPLSLMKGGNRRRKNCRTKKH